MTAPRRDTEFWNDHALSAPSRGIAAAKSAVMMVVLFMMVVGLLAVDLFAADPAHNQ